MITNDEYLMVSTSLGIMYQDNTPALNRANLVYSDLTTIYNDIINNDLYGPNTPPYIGIFNRQTQTLNLTQYLTSQINNDTYVFVETKALQNFILKTYSSVDNYLSTNNIKVTQEFATLSGLCGFPISSGNIQ
jgi:hypothetical protein